MKTRKGKINKNIDLILSEIESVLAQVDQEQVDLFVKEIKKAKTIVLCGAGRVGMATRGFAMRLGHMGFRSFMIGDATVPSIKRGDLLIASSGSGETQTIYDLVALAKKNGSRVALVSSYVDHNKSRMARLADTMVILNAPSKVKHIDGFYSQQPMTTLNEQCLGIFYDAVVLQLMEELKESHENMWSRHSNLE